jgi:hypothetical protein
VSSAAASDQPPPVASDAQVELARQVDVLVDKGVPAVAGLTELAFRALLAPVADALPPRPPAEGELPFVVVLPPELVPALALVERMELRGKPGLSSMTAEELSRFRPSPDVHVPDSPYLAVGVDTGAATLGVAPQDALPGLLARGRSPLTLEEGLAVVLQHPEVLRERNCFEMLGSRGGDRRVTGLWVRKGGAPRLGWCWWGAPHDWLGAASCAERRV